MLQAIKDWLDIEPDFIRMFNISLGILLCCHFTGCLFWLIKVVSNDFENVNAFLSSNRH